MAADESYPILFNKITYHGIKIKPVSVVVSQADPHSWILHKDPVSAMGSFHNIQLRESA